MRRTITMVLTVVTLMLGVTALALPVAAAPAVPYNESDCVDYGGGYEFCYTAKGVVRENETRSGNTQYHLTERRCSTLTGPGGDVVAESCTQDNYVLHRNDGEIKVFHTNWKLEEAGTGYECIHSYNVTYANGEVRHNDSQFECNLPL